MKRLTTVALVSLLALASSNANAWFFFWFPIPTGGSNATSDNTCVAETAQEGDTMNSTNGNVAKIVKLSGTSSRCKDPSMPILATVDYTSGITFTSKAGIELPDKFKPMGLADRQKFFDGILLKAKTDDGKLYIQVSAGKRAAVSSMPEFVKKWKAGLKNFDDPTYSETEELTVDGFPMWRFEQKGKLKNLFGTRMTMLHTVMEAKDEFLIIQAWGYDNEYPDEVEVFKKLPSAIKGLTPPIPLTPIATTPSMSKDASGMEPRQGTVVDDTKPSTSGTSSAAQSQASTTQPAETAMARRLRELSELRNQGLITESEYKKKRQAILSDL